MLRAILQEFGNKTRIFGAINLLNQRDGNCEITNARVAGEKLSFLKRGETKKLKIFCNRY